MMLKTIFLIFCLFISSSARSELTVDGTNTETLVNSIKAMQEATAESKRPIFDEARKLILQKLLDKSILVLSASNAFPKTKKESELIVFEMISKALNGKNTSELAVMAKQFTDIDIAVIEKTAQHQLLHSDFLKQISVDKISYRIGKNILGPAAFVKATITNNSSHAISEIRIMCSLTSPDRSSPWLKEKIVHEIPGGIEPGETLVMDMEPNGIDWENIKDIREDAVITAFVYQTNDAQGVQLWEVPEHNTNEFSKTIALRKLSDSFSELSK